MALLQAGSNMASRALRHARRLIVLVVGLTVVLIGVAMLVLPGPAFVVIPLGLAILATEFVWAQHLLHSLRDHAQRTVNGIRGNHKP
ncbi:MAG: PGPGW domain-containing protein [Candidatus Binatia bacterium]